MLSFLYYIVDEIFIQAVTIRSPIFVDLLMVKEYNGNSKSDMKM